MFSLQDGDIINFVNVNLEGLEDNADGNDWFADDAVQVHSYLKSIIPVVVVFRALEVDVNEVYDFTVLE